METPYTATQQECELLLHHWFREYLAEYAVAETQGFSCRTADEAPSENCE